ncbi:MAG TPA: hypothetical protein VIV36_07050 [Gaiella sp.]
MTPLERELQALSSALDWPETPDVSRRVVALMAEERPRPVVRRRLALALAVVLAALVAVLAVPPARTAVLDWLGIGGAQIIRVDDLPSVSATPGLEILGDRVTLDEAQERAGFPFADPPEGERAPDQILLAPGMRVTYVWGADDRARLLLTQFPGDATEPGLVKKLVSSATRIDMLDIDGHRALWLEGGPHAVLFLTPDGNIGEDLGWLAGNTLLVENDGVTVRIEAQVDRADAIELARSLLR